MKTLFYGGSITTLAGGRADWVLVDGQNVAATGVGEPPAADRSIDLEGGALVPSFCDAHVHLSATGLYSLGLDLRDMPRKNQIIAAFARRAEQGGLLFAGNFEDSDDDPLNRYDLDGVVGDRPALLARADMHSCVVSTALLDHLDTDVEGVDRDTAGRPTGYLREQAAGQAWRWFDNNLAEYNQREAVRTALELALSRGVTEVHEMFVVEWRGWSSLPALLEECAGGAVSVLPYVATDEVARVKALGLEAIGGDYFLDGSFGSHTAWLTERYVSDPPPGSSDVGIAYRSDAEVVEFFTEAHTAGLQVGVHAIGDAAIAQALRAWQQVAAADASVTTAGHRLEHFECAWDEHIDAAARLGLRISAQPAFDRFWGGESGLYSQRIGTERAAGMNRFRTMHDAGLTVGAGSDSTVTPLDPFLQMASLREHHVENERLSPEEALRMHTLGSRSLASRQDGAGVIAPGEPADLVWLDRSPVEVDSEELLKTEVLGTWVNGNRVWPQLDEAA